MMEKNRIDLNTYERDSQFYGDLSFVVTIKSFDLQAIRKRYLQSKGNSKTGSVARRAVAEGGLAYFHLAAGAVEQYEVLQKCNEPRGIDFRHGIFAYSSENEVHLIQDGKKRTLLNPWFSYIHTVSISADNSRLLVSSSGFDVIFEFQLSNLALSKEWWAWENGFEEGQDPKDGSTIIVSRQPLPIDALDGKRNLVVSDPSKDSLPTAMRTAFINSVAYNEGDEDYWIATFFHEGAVYEIASGSGNSLRIMDGMTSPHGGQKLGPHFMATDTRGGAVVVKQEDQIIHYDFSNLPNKPTELGQQEWIQNSKILGDNIISLDANRNSFVIFNPTLQKIDLIPFDANLAIQDMVWMDKEDMLAIQPLL